MLRIVFCFVLAALACAGCEKAASVATAQASVPSRPSGQGSTVRFHYSLSVDGQQVESSAGKEPMTATVGSGDLVPGLEEALGAMHPGDRKHVTISPDKGYGPHHPEGVQKVPLSAFKGLKGLRPGAVVGGQANGRAFRAVVKAMDDKEVTLDLNHPLAGKTLEFDLELVSSEAGKL